MNGLSLRGLYFGVMATTSLPLESLTVIGAPVLGAPGISAKIFRCRPDLKTLVVRGRPELDIDPALAPITGGRQDSCQFRAVTALGRESSETRWCHAQTEFVRATRTGGPGHNENGAPHLGAPFNFVGQSILVHCLFLLHLDLDMPILDHHVGIGDAVRRQLAFDLGDLLGVAQVRVQLGQGNLPVYLL